MDAELLQDFLVEAGELVEQLDEQLIGLEEAPDDGDLLNRVFRAFHTIKGGAGFLGVATLVELCHRAEDLLNQLRSGERLLEPDVMDAVLASVDEVKRMFEELKAGQSPAGAALALLDTLDAIISPEGAPASQAPPAAAQEADPVLAEFEGMLEAARRPAAVAAASSADADAITDDEFEALLDALDQPQAPDQPQALDVAKAQEPVSAAVAPPAAASAAPSAAPPTAPPPAAEPTLRVGSARIDDIMDLVGELVLVRNRLAALRGKVADDEIGPTMSQLNLVTSDLQASVMRLRMQPVSKVFGRFTRVVRDLARQVKKEVELETQGENTELDRGMVESLADPLTHLVRNAVDHGIESPEERERAGKPRRGRVSLVAQQEGNNIIVSVSDDGAGLDAERIRAKALERGLIDARTGLQMPEEEILQLVFLPGFSTRDAVSDLSGRGVGMDVVKTQVSSVNGTVEIRSERGKGSRVIIRLPLTLAIMPTLMVVVHERRFALPLSSVEEIINYDPAARSIMDGRVMLSRHGEVMPLLDLGCWVRGVALPAGAPRSVVIALASGRRVGLVVDRLIGQEEIVIKSLGARLDGLPGFAGATITGDGGIALIVDVASLHAHWRTLAVGEES